MGAHAAQVGHSHPCYMYHQMCEGQATLKEVLEQLGVFLAVVVLSALVYVCYAYAPRITRAVSPSTVHGIVRVIAFILLCIGVQIAWNGMSALLGTVVRH